MQEIKTIHNGNTMVKAVLVGLNASFNHTCLAIRQLRAYCEGQTYVKGKIDIVCREFTINDPIRETIASLLREDAAVYGFSCYIWNISVILEMTEILKKCKPDCRIVLGGPEISFETEEFYCLHPEIDHIVRGPGEAVFADILLSLVSSQKGWEEGIPAIVDGEAVPLDRIPFAYSENDFGMTHKRYYYETTRGCPFHCSYCLSSADTGVDCLSMERIQSELEFFIGRNISQVKLVDRTFNFNEQRSIEIWTFLMNLYQKKPFQTNFHFEIAGDILSEKSFTVLKNAPKGLFQFEIGVQTTNEMVLQNITRKTSLDRLFTAVKTIHSYGTIDIHLDLIAGLPGEDWASFASSFNQVFSLQPEMLQLGFLKVLKGSPIRKVAEAYGLVYSGRPPYEIAQTGSMSFFELNRLKKIEDLLQIYYNSNQFRNCLQYVLSMFPDAFSFFSKFEETWEAKGFFKRKCSRADLILALFHFAAEQLELSQDRSMLSELEVFRDLLKFDFYRFDKKGDIEELHMNHSLHHPALPKTLEKPSWYLPNGLPVCNRPRLEYYCFDANHLMKTGKVEKRPSFALYEMNGDKPLLFDVLIP